MTYLDFIVHLGPDSGSGHAVQVESPAGGGGGLFAPPSESGFRHFHVDTTEEAEAGPLTDAREIGQRLFSALFTGQVRRLFDQSHGQVQGTETGLRIRIRLDPNEARANHLASLPWELLFEKERGEFLALGLSTPISRELVVPRPPRTFSFGRPLHILAVTANPPTTAVLDLDRERHLLEQALRQGTAMHADFLEVATAAELRRALRRKRYHVLHFMGHGEIDPRTGKGTVLFAGQAGGLDAISGSGLADELRDCESLQLVVLNACSTGQWTDVAKDPFAGVAAALVLSGLPAVLAMQAPISDQAAIAFSHSLYQHLADGDPVDAAVVEGRLAIHRLERNGSSAPEWATPVLYLRGRESPFQSSPPPPTRWLLRVVVTVLSLSVIVTATSIDWSDLAQILGIGQKETIEPPPEDGDDVEGGDHSVRAKPDIRTLQQPPYEPRTFSTFIQPPIATTVDTDGWESLLEQRLAARVADLPLEKRPSPNVSWLVVVAFDKAQVTPQVVDDLTMQRCDLRARLDIYREREPLTSSQPLSATTSGFNPDRACDAGLDKLAQQIAGKLQDRYLSS